MYNLHGPEYLFDSAYGYVLQCECCDRIQIQFRDHTLLVDEDEFEELVETVTEARGQVQSEEGVEKWQLQAGTDAGAVRIVLPKPALRVLHELLQGAWWMFVLRKRVEAVASGADGIASDVLRDHVPAGQRPSDDG